MLVELPIQMLRGDVIAVVAATFIASLGVAALGLYALRKRSADVTPLAFAVFALLYATRLAIATRTIQAALSESGGPWGYIGAALTYAILPAGAWMGESLLGAGWRGSLKVVRAIAIIVAPVGIAGMFMTGRPEWLMPLNNVLVLVMLGAIGATGIRHPLDVSTAFVRVGVIVAGAFILAENLRAVGVLRWPPGIEFLGILAFVSSIAFAVADRFLRTEGRLAAVERELATARRIQQAILPDRVPELQRFRLDVRYLPMTEVAGDFYDFLNVTGSHGAVLIADVSGHGVPAALIASMVKVAAISHGGSAMDPGALLSAVSRTLDGQLGGQFLTAMCVHLDGERGKIAYAGAGHPPLLHWRAAEQKLDVLNSDGLLIGLVPSQYMSRTVPVQRGDRLLVYTDGVLEATNKDDAFFGDERFHAAIAENAAKSGAELGRSILEAMIRWSGKPAGFADDVTLIVIEVQ
jgi:sigma-B regulation protein RsbU (phosphoserine phosphatase)